MSALIQTHLETGSARSGLPTAPPLPPTDEVEGAGGVGSSPATAPAGAGSMTAVMVLLQSRTAAWAAARLVLGRRALGPVPGMRFAKVLGSGSDGGFGLVPSATRGGLFCLFDDEAAACAFLLSSRTMAAYRRHASELLTLTLRPVSSRGSWDGMTLPAIARTAVAGPLEPVAALTRGSIRLTRLAPFWRHTPAAQRALEHAPGCRLGVGLGEAPLLRQATFSLWDSVQAMDDYARHGAHLQAIRAAQGGGHFAESMFVRFVPLDVQGCWKGVRHG